MTTDRLSPAAKFLIKDCPEAVNALASYYIHKLDDFVLGPKPSVSVTMSFDAELTPEALELLLGKYSPTTLRTADEIGFTDSFTGETLTFRKLKGGAAP